MKLEFLNRRGDSSSEDSDDVIPPTPAAKSTPLVSSSRFRKQSTSSDSSSNRQHLETPKFIAPVRRTAQSDSSSDEEAAPVNRSVIVKTEARSSYENSSSSEDEDNGQRNAVKTPTASCLNKSGAGRSVHSMSSSDSDNSDMDTTAVGSHLAVRKDDSSEDSDNENVHLNTSALPVKVEKATSTESSENESDNERQTAQSARHQADESDSSSDDEGTKAKQQEKRDAMSSEESDDNGRDQKPFSRNINDSESTSEDEDRSKDGRPNFKSASVQSNQNGKDSSDDESSEDEKPAPKLAFSHGQQQPKDSSDEQSSEDEKPAPKPAFSHGQQQPKDSSDEESSEDEDHTSKPVLSNLKQPPKDSSDEDSSEDEEPKSNPTTLHRKTQGADSSDEDTSNDEKPEFKPTLTCSKAHTKDSSDESSEDEKPIPKPSVVHSKQTRDSSDNESSENEANNISNKEHNFKHIPTSHTNQHRTESSDTDSDGGIMNVLRPAAKPGSKKQDAKRGAALLGEAFMEREPLQVENTLLTVDDIGSDDEIWLLQCPKSMNASALKKKCINLASDHDLQLEDGPTFKRFTVSPEENTNNSVTCLLPQNGSSEFRISLLPIKGKVVIQEHIHVPKLKLPEASAKGPVPLPCNLKVRHPLLGIGFEQHIAEAKKALKANKKSRKRKHESGNNYSTPNGEMHISSISSYQTISSEKKKKLKHMDTSLGTELYNRSEDNTSGKKRKKDVHEHASFSLDEGKGKGSGSGKKNKDKKSSSTSEFLDNSIASKAVDGSFLNDTYRKKNKKSKKDNGSEENISNNMKSGADGHQPSWHIPQASETPVSVLDNVSSSTKKKKSKTDSRLLDPSEIKQELDTTGYVNGISESGSRKRKKKEGYQESNSQGYDQTPAKKKKYSM